MILKILPVFALCEEHLRTAAHFTRIRSFIQRQIFVVNVASRRIAVVPLYFVDERFLIEVSYGCVEVQKTLSAIETFGSIWIENARS